MSGPGLSVQPGPNAPWHLPAQFHSQAPYTALAGAIVHYWLASRHQLPTMTTYSTTNLLQLPNHYRLKYHNNQPTGYGSAVANTTFADSERKSSREAVPPGTGTAKRFIITWR